MSASGGVPGITHDSGVARTHPGGAVPTAHSPAESA
ncbi:hypothetical protein EV639_104183 [Rathayibacter tanaceti]|uniref:Uncharacterized protein n=2 Tax=Rathayibacter tanaceti TaxID=1671680 RepID=A0ACD2XKC2_9MICO|nr:hypothetical protein ACH61_02759 [Rathayibacter tanaceti]TCO37514.1 hypothetical protein EV639_104183 [Rathayibacter tanaceti]